MVDSDIQGDHTIGLNFTTKYGTKDFLKNGTVPSNLVEKVIVHGVGGVWENFVIKDKNV